MSEQKGIKHSFPNDNLVSSDDSENSEKIFLAAHICQSYAEDITPEMRPENTPFQAQIEPEIEISGFEVKLFGSLKDQGDKIIVTDTMADDYKPLLRHLQEDITLIENKMEAAFNAWIEAETDEYHIPKLKEDFKNCVYNLPLSSSNVWKLLEKANTLRLMPLVSRCKDYLEKNIELSLCDVSFLEVKAETVIQILNMSHTNVSESFLLKSVINWGKHKVDTGEDVSLAGVLKPLMSYIHFGALTSLEFCEFLNKNNDVLEKHDALAILKHLTKPLTYTLPKWCCVNHRGRFQDLEQRNAKKLKTQHQSLNH